jgi:hypothetical protein
MCSQTAAVAELPGLSSTTVGLIAANQCSIVAELSYLSETLGGVLATVQRSIFDPLPKPSARRPTGEPTGIRHFICYHDPDVLGYDFRDIDHFHVLTNKSTRDLEGDVVWLIGRSWSGLAYYLVSRFRVEQVWASEGWIHLSGSKGHQFSPPRRVTKKPWFVHYKDAMHGLSHGLQHVKNEIVLRGLETELKSVKTATRSR